MSETNDQKLLKGEKLAELLKSGEEKIEAGIDFSPELNMERTVISYIFKVGNVSFTTRAVSYISTCRRQRDEFLLANIEEIIKPY